MMKAARVAVVLLTAVLQAGCDDDHHALNTDDLGRILLFEPKDSSTGFVFLLSDAGGWSREMTGIAKQLRARGLIVAGVDATQLIDHFKSSTDPCIDLASAFEATSQSVQKAAKLNVYFLPILAGVGTGATLALAGVWQAGPETFAGAATVNFEPQLITRMPLCADPAAQPQASGKGFTYSPPPHLFGWWQGLWTTAASPAAGQFAAAMGVERPQVEATGSAPAALLEVLDWGRKERSRDTAEALKLGELAVVDLPGRPGAREAVILLSGDGGWRDLDRSLGEILANAGVHVIGIDSLRYFWSKKTPETLGADLDRLINDLVRRNGISSIGLVGFSFGADVLPAAINHLGADARSHVTLVSLLAFGRNASFEIHVEGWFGGDSAEDALPVAPDLSRLDRRLVQCIYGEEEADESGCLDPHLHGAEVIGLPGGHHFDEDYPALAQRILLRMRQHS